MDSLIALEADEQSMVSNRKVFVEKAFEMFDSNKDLHKTLYNNSTIKTIEQYTKIFDKMLKQENSLVSNDKFRRDKEL